MTLLARTYDIDENAAAENREETGGLPAIGALLKRLRGNRTLRQVEADTSIPNSYVSNIEKGRKSPGLKTLTRLASYYDVPLQDLLQVAGLTQPSPADTEGASILDVERSYAFVVADPNMSFARPTSVMPIDGQRFVVEMYQLFTGRKLL